MKTQRNLLIALVLVFTTTFTSNIIAGNSVETGRLIVKVEANHNNYLGLQMANLNKKFTKIRISDMNEKVWLSVNVTKELGYAKKINLRNMPSGTYILFVENSGQRFVQAFAKNDRGVALYQQNVQKASNKAVAVLTSSITKHKKGELITRITTPDAFCIGIQLSNLDYQETNIQLIGQYCTSIIREKVEGQAGYAKKINLTGIEAGHYYIVIKAREVTQIQFFSIDEKGVRLNEYQTWNARKSKISYASK